MRIKMSYYEIIMKYHPEILVAKYHFVGPKSAKCALYMVLLGLAMAMLVG